MSRNAAASDALLPGTGYSPTYGLSESSERFTEGKSRWAVVIVCALSACLASLQTGMSLSFSSIVISELNKSSVSYTDDWNSVHRDGTIASIIGVSCRTS